MKGLPWNKLTVSLRFCNLICRRYVQDPVAYGIEHDLSIAHVTMILGIHLIREKAKGQALYVLQHVDLAADKAIINEVVLICADDQYVLRDLVSHGLQIVKL